ncbi:OTU domain-containing protein 7B-like isoform X2 [Gigantopelta aegis]|uniref:OTU domain-containing protein 7B-like isoform X2 n=1 Tax=Gigantopelta aegis TaxID=1735272 RepID=UPI001B8899DC|nr:OTU domain-containing protein 7B-like isoform X2 [Gigantopelta aegis]
MASAVSQSEKVRILEELVSNTAADKNFAIKVLTDSDWNIKEAYKVIERMCQCSKPLPTKDGEHCENRHTAEVTVVSHQSGGIPIPIQHLHTGVGSAVEATTNVSAGKGGDTFPMRRPPNDSRFPLIKSDIHDDRNNSQIKVGSLPSSGERFVPIQVEKGAAVRLGNPANSTSGQQGSRIAAPGATALVRPQARVIATSGLHHGPQPAGMVTGELHQTQPDGGRVTGPAAGIQQLKGSDVKVTSQQKLTGGNLVSDKSDRSENSTSVPKLRRGISNILENMSLVNEARSNVLHDIAEDGHNHIFLLTFQLPDLTIYPGDFRAFLQKELIETSTLVSLEQAGRLNWWAELRICQRLLPMATSGDGNCLLHAASLAMCGIHDRELILRNALYASLTRGPHLPALYRRWRWQQTISNKESGLVLSEEEWSAEWENLLKLASLKPRTLPETCKRNSCCDSPVTQGSNSTDPVVYESLEEFHVFVLAHVIQRPIIVVADTFLKDSKGEALAPIPFGGIYLPLETAAKTCYRSPLLLTYDAAHFSALVPMDQSGLPEEIASLSTAIPLVDPEFRLLPLHFHVDPGDRYDWTKLANNKDLRELSTEDKLNLLQQYLDVEKLTIPSLDSADSTTDNDRVSCGSYDSDDSVGCVANKERKKDAARVSQQMQHVAKQFGSIGKSMGKKLKKNFGNIGKGMKNLDEKKSKKKSVGSVITQSTKVIATTDAGKNSIWCARLTLQQSSIHAELLKNYMQDAEQRFSTYRELVRRKNEEIKKRVPVYPASSSTRACQSAIPGCHGPAVHDASYQCKSCYDLQKQQEKSGSYHTFPRGKTLEGSTDTYGRSKFYDGVRGSSCLPEQEPRLGRFSNVDRQHSLSAGDVSYPADRGRVERTPSPDYDNVEYSFNTQGGDGRAVDQYGTYVRPPRTRCLNTGCKYVGHSQYSGLCEECYDRHTNMGYIVGKSHHIRL